MKELTQRRVLNVEIGGVLVVVTAEEGFYTGAAYQRIVSGKALTFRPASDGTMIDDESRSRWNINTGIAESGARAGEQLTRLPARQSFWFAWKAYNPTTELR